MLICEIVSTHDRLYKGYDMSTYTNTKSRSVGNNSLEVLIWEAEIGG